MKFPVPNYARMLEMKLRELMVRIAPRLPDVMVPGSKITAIAPNGSYLEQKYVDGIASKFDSRNIIKLAEFVSAKHRSISCTALPLPNGKEAEIQTSGDLVIRVITDYHTGAGDGEFPDSYADKVIRRVDILFQDNLALPVS